MKKQKGEVFPPVVSEGQKVTPGWIKDWIKNRQGSFSDQDWFFLAKTLPNENEARSFLSDFIKEATPSERKAFVQAFPECKIFIPLRLQKTLASDGIDPSSYAIPLDDQSYKPLYEFGVLQIQEHVPTTITEQKLPSLPMVLLSHWELMESLLNGVDAERKKKFYCTVFSFALESNSIGDHWDLFDSLSWGKSFALLEAFKRVPNEFKMDLLKRLLLFPHPTMYLLFYFQANREGRGLIEERLVKDPRFIEYVLMKGYLKKNRKLGRSNICALIDKVLIDEGYSHDPKLGRIWKGFISQCDNPLTLHILFSFLAYPPIPAKFPVWEDILAQSWKAIDNEVEKDSWKFLQLMNTLHLLGLKEADLKIPAWQEWFSQNSDELTTIRAEGDAYLKNKDLAGIKELLTKHPVIKEVLLAPLKGPPFETVADCITEMDDLTLHVALCFHDEIDHIEEYINILFYDKSTSTSLKQTLWNLSGGEAFPMDIPFSPSESGSTPSTSELKPESNHYTLIVGGERIAIDDLTPLAQNSAHFRAIPNFRGKENSTKEITLEGFQPEYVKRVLESLKSRTLPHFKDIRDQIEFHRTFDYLK